MKINDKIISIPPHLSTSWDSVQSVRIEDKKDEKILIVSLSDGSHVEIPDLDKDTFDKVFEMHASYLEHKRDANSSAGGSSEDLKSGFPSSISKAMDLLKSSEGFLSASGKMMGFPIDIGNGEGFGDLEAILRHNPDQSNLPPLPREIIEQIKSISKVIPIDDDALPKPVEGCNCTYCQIARSMHHGIEEKDYNNNEEEEVTDEDLRFREWDIKQSGDKLYTVTNSLDAKEEYKVFLGDPIGCTCGQKNCEHIQAVLRS